MDADGLESIQKIVIESEGNQIDSKFLPMPGHLRFRRTKIEIFHPDGAVFRAKQDGEVFLRLNDFLFKGGADYLFRISVTKRPRIQFVDPPLVRIGEPQQMVVYVVRTCLKDNLPS